jgi:nucleoid DNA-binding protein
MCAMTRSDLIATIASRFPSLVAKDTEVAVKIILDAMSNALVRKAIVSRSAALVAST